MAEKVVCWVCFAVGLLVLILTAISFPVSRYLLQKNIKKETVLVNGTQLFQSWQKPEVPIYFQIFVFDLLNPEEFVQGNAKPVFIQKGPYTYKEQREKINVQFYNNTLTYQEIISYHFDENLSAGPEDDNVTTVNVFLLTLLDWCRNHQSLIFDFIIKWILPLVADEPVVITKTIAELTWGYTDPLLEKIHNKFPIVFPSDQVGYFVGKNNSLGKVYTIHTGEKDYSKVGVISSYDGESHVNFWSTPYANMINGTDGTVFSPPMLSKTDPLHFFVDDLCRSLVATYKGKSNRVHRITAYRYTAPKYALENATINPDNAGFCTPAGNCLDSGVLNLSSCTQVFGLNVPIIASMPHFYQAAKQYQEAVVGLDPTLPDLDTELLIEPHTAFLVSANKRIQLNLYLQPSRLAKDAKDLEEMIFPVLWLNESLSLDEEHADELKHQVFRWMDIIRILQIVFFGFGAILVIGAMILHAVCCSKQLMNDTDSEAEPIMADGEDSTSVNNNDGIGGEEEQGEQ